MNRPYSLCRGTSEATPRADEACGALLGARASCPTGPRRPANERAPPQAHHCPCGQDARAPKDASRKTWLNCKDDGASRSLEIVGDGATPPAPRRPDSCQPGRQGETSLGGPGQTGGPCYGAARSHGEAVNAPGSSDGRDSRLPPESRAGARRSRRRPPARLGPAGGTGRVVDRRGAAGDRRRDPRGNGLSAVPGPPRRRCRHTP